jgi:5-methyltetrahydropteroyltriglutamate--homocysteine methyltransferase
MSGAPKPPFRADHVGSLLRPQQLLDARLKARSGELTGQALGEIQDQCIRDVVARQQSLGLPVVTDGEFRRDWWHIDFLDALEGVDAAPADAMVKFQGSEQPLTLKVTGKIQRNAPIFVDHFKFLKSVAKATSKITIPAPAMLYHRTGRAAISEAAYPDLEEMWADAAKAYRAEIRELGEAGCEYLQMDDVSFAYFCDPGYHETFRKRGEDPEQLLRTYSQAINQSLEGRPKGMTVALHTCRGNFMSTWAAQGGYEPVAETLFNDVNVDAYFLEFDSDRAGGFEPLRFLPRGKKVVLGLVTTKTPVRESRDSILRKIDEATKHVDIDALCLSPQCGFSSTHHGNKITVDDQWRKLELVLDVASRVWS